MASVQLRKKIFLGEWTSDFLMQLLVGFNIQIKDLKTIEYSSDEEKRIYENSNGTYQDIYFLYFVDYISDILSASKNNMMPNAISRYPLYIDYAFQDSLKRLESKYPSLDSFARWLNKIFEANEKYIGRSKSANLLIQKYSLELLEVIKDNDKEICAFLENFSTSGQISEKSLLSINGFDAPLSEMRNNNLIIEFQLEKNILIDKKTRMMIPLAMEYGGKIKNITPAKIGAVIFYAKTMTSSNKEKSIRLNQAQVVASYFIDYPLSSKKNAISNLFFKELSIFSNDEIEKIRESPEIEEKAKILSVAILFSEYKKHFIEIKPLIDKAVKEHLRKRKNTPVDAVFLYDISRIIKNHIGEITLYKELPGFKKDIKEYLNKEIKQIIQSNIKETI